MQPHLQEMIPAIERSLENFHLYRTSDGIYQLSRRKAGWLREWFPGLTDYQDELNHVLSDLQNIQVIFVGGTSLGCLLNRAYRETSQIEFHRSARIYVLEHELTYLAAWLHIPETSSLLSDSRVMIFAGSESLGCLSRHLLDDDDFSYSQALVINIPGRVPISDEIQQLLSNVTEERVRRMEELHQQIIQRYQDRNLAYYRDRFKPGATILGVTSRRTMVLQYSMRDLKHAFEKQGYHFHLLIESGEHTGITPLRLLRTLLETDPVLLVLIDHLRYEFAMFPENLPLLCWIQDSLPNLLCRKAGESLGPLDFVCGFYRPKCIKEFGYPAERFFSTSIPVSTQLFHDGPVEEELHRRLQCDVLYAGTALESPESYLGRWKGGAIPEAYPLLEAIYREVLMMLQRGEHLQQEQALQLTRHFIEQSDVTMPPETADNLGYFFAYGLFDTGFRLQTLEWIADWADRTGRVFKIYGYGWEQHPVLSKYAAGYREHGEPLRQAYRCAKLSVQCLPTGYLHQRTMEGLASGSLVIGRYCPANFGQLSCLERHRKMLEGNIVESTNTFFPHLERIVFASAEEFEVLAERLLQDEDYYHGILEEYRGVVYSHLNYEVIVKDIIERIQNLLHGANDETAR